MGVRAVRRSSRGTTFVPAIVVLLAAAGSSAAQFPTSRALTNTEIQVPPNYFTMTPPPAGGTYVDAVFGTTILRLTDATGLAGGNIVPEYSQTSSFNLDDSYLILGWPNGWHLYDGDGNLIDRLGDLVGGGEREPRWSRINPEWLYFHTGTQIRRYDVAANQVVDLGPPFAGTIDFGGETGDVSDNERITVFRDQRYVSVWDLAAGVQVSAQELDLNQPPINGSPADYVTITKDGDSFVVGFETQGIGRGQGSELFDVDGNFIVQVLNTLGHAAMGRDVDGTQVLFMGNGNTDPPQPASCFPGILKISLDGSATRTCLVQVVWGVVEHFSAHGNDGWLYVSTYDPGALPVPAASGDNNAGDDDDWHLYTNEIYRVRADGSVVERLAHHRSTAASFWLQPHANISISGNKLVYGSDFQLNGRAGYADTYLIDLTTNFPPGVPTALAPSGAIMTNAPTYTWTRTAGAQRYLLRVDGPLGAVHAQWHAAANICSGGVCSVGSPTVKPLAFGSHMFDISAANRKAVGPTSAPMAFHVAPRLRRPMRRLLELR